MTNRVLQKNQKTAEQPAIQRRDMRDPSEWTANRDNGR